MVRVIVMVSRARRELKLIRSECCGESEEIGDLRVGGGETGWHAEACRRV
jgi:hypothetical protein